MKHLIYLLLIIFPCIFVNAQGSKDNSGSTYIHCTKFYISKPLRDLPDYKSKPGATPREASDENNEDKKHKENNTYHPEVGYDDPVRQYTPGSASGPIAPIVNFQGATDSFWCPGDPNGAVGPTRYVQTINDILCTVFDKSGNTIMSPKDLGYLWPGNPDDGDPVVLYDKFADRWFISEFQVTNTPNQLCVGVSTTNDPTGSYYVWEYSMGYIEPDYPKYSIWSDGYYVTFQGFNVDSGYVPISPQKVGVLERTKMLNGDASAGLILSSIVSPPDLLCGPYSTCTSEPKTLDCDASALPPYGTPNYLVFFENIATGGYSNSIVMYKLTTDTALHTLTVARADSFSVSTFNTYFTGGTRKDISQPGYPHDVSALDGRFTYRVPYMKFTGYNSVVLSNTVNLGGLVAGIRWYELRQNDTTQKWGIYQQGTYGPNDGVSRWNGAICMDYDGNIGLTYSVADSVHLYPGIRYTGRLVTDPPGQMTFAEQTAIAGTSSIYCGHRWGDYSQLDLDPSDGLTFWGINQYGGSTISYQQLNRIFSFKLAGALGINEVQNQTGIKVYQNGNFLEVAVNGLTDNEKLSLDLFDVSGRLITSESITPVSNLFNARINVSSFAHGIYLVRIGKLNFQKVVKTVIN